MNRPLANVLQASGANLVQTDDLPRAADFGNPQAEYRAAASAAAICDMSHRALIELTGADRAGWLNNLVTNAVRDLQPGDGIYAFALNIKGRILFDLNVIVHRDTIWLDIDRSLIDKAMTHLDRYIISEDVTLTDRSNDFTRIGLIGPGAVDIADGLGATHAPAMASLGSTTVPLQGRPRTTVRHDFAGVFGLELYVESADAEICWNRLIEIGAPVELTPIGDSAIDVLRIEAGIPVYGRDIDEDVLPAETGQTDRAVSYVKGCYLGQEIVERMRSREALARMLVGLQFDSDDEVTPGTELVANENPVGHVTSTCHSHALNTTIGLGYLKTTHAEPGTNVSISGAPATEARVISLPCRNDRA